MQSIITCGILGVEYDPDLDVDGYYSLNNRRHSFNGHFDGDRLSENRSGASPLHYYSAVRNNSSPPSYKVQPKESDSERKARLLQEAKKSKEKAEKKRLKKLKRKQRKEMEKAKQNPVKTEEEKDGDQSDESKPGNDQKKDLAAAKDTDSDGSSVQESSDEEDTKNDSGDFEELDMASTFVTKAALIAQRKLEQKPKSDKKKTPEKEKSRSVPVKASEDKEDMKGVQQKDSTVSSGSTLDNIKISTDLAILGNKFASSGDYSMAVKYFTNAIKYNPKEFKLFGNRSFCFEKLQEYEKALADAELSLSVSPGWVKGLFRKGRALAGLKRYEEAADAFRDVLKRDSSYAEAAQELMRVQIIQLMAYGFTREQSSNALIIHGTVDKALEVLSKLHPPGAVLNGPLPPPQVANVSGISPVLSANASPASVAPAQSYEPSKKPLLSKPVVQNIPNVDNQSKPVYNQAVNLRNYRAPLELFPVWVGNLCHPVTEATISKLFSRAGHVFSMKFLPSRRCAFVNFTKQEHCDEAIRRFHGFDLHGVKIVVRYPDRISPGIGISRSARTASDLQDENFRHYSDGK